jgi:hypothetical protein
MDADMPWVYTYKQKYYTDFLVTLGKKHQVTDQYAIDGSDKIGPSP